MNIEVNKKKYKTLSLIVSIILFGASLIFCIFLYKKGLLSDSDKLKEFVNGFGAIGPVIFILVEITQAVFPVIPGGIGLIAGVVLFGQLKGFFLNYIGICLGSFAAFYIGRNAGKPIIEAMFPRKLIDRVEKYTNVPEKFTRVFAWLVVLPGAPDDLLCYLAGSTSMSWSTYLPIILLGKIPSISLYSLGIYYVFEKWIFH